MEIKCEYNLQQLFNQGKFGTGLKVILFFADNINDHALDIIKQCCMSMLQTQHKQIVFDIFYTLYGLFIKENFTGPSYHYQNADRKLHLENLLTKQVIPKSQTNQINKQELEDLGLVELLPLINQISRVSEYEIYYSQANQEYILNKLQCCGELFKRVIQLKHIFLVCKQILELLHTTNPIYQLWWARLNFMHNQFLDNPVQELKDEILNSFQEFLDNYPVDSKDQAKLYTEFSYIYNYYYRYQEAEVCLLKAQQLLKVRFELTGKLGKKTKFQEEKLPQLVAQIIDQESVEKEIRELPKVQEVLQQYAPQQVNLEEESILFDKPVVDGEIKQDSLSLEEQIVLLGLIHHYKKTLPNDEILQQQVQAYLNLMLDKSNSWIVYSQGLLLRSLNEFNHLKRMERALIQMQTLVDQFNDIQPDSDLRALNLFYSNYPDYYNLSGILAEQWMKVGMMTSGYEIFARLEMWEECVECIVGTGDTQRALKEIEQITAKGLGTVKMKCITGEIKQDPKILKEAWKDSKKRFARAQRSLGEFYFFKEKNYEKSIKSYRKAVKINSYHQKSWYIMGCAYMRLNKLEDAIKSLGEAVRINENDGEIWGNISSCLVALKKFSEAQSALEQGVKYASTDWRLWSNLMAISLRNKKFVRFYSCIEKLVQLDHRELIDEQIIQKITQTFAYQTDQLNQENLVQSNINKKRILKLYEYLAKEIGQKYYIWEGLAKYTELLMIYDQRTAELEKKQILDLLPYYNDVVQYRLKSCQMLQILNWERDMQICQNLVKQLTCLNQDVQLIKDEETIKNVTVYISQQKSRLETILEKKINF
ncbi:unnamed protein product (macronuclear) [Paramecium tetraurelia]|uniref:Uncharacterized protein n=1 Tax=Paramecium tetraurelia TaxID=5888 RepID=A0D0I5_PARTE|nr:uncharacterized protein GSPATT00012104001 [Paramecium tetraurelia]CAK76552.1 unnamed protein product [Paramecium tetraurelia]|eukprot:XP_001443949.1 hypothetical protein (macronuclear) [Paramecium tetraurelia strain d4-2]